MPGADIRPVSSSELSCHRPGGLGSECGVRRSSKELAATTTPSAHTARRPLSAAGATKRGESRRWTVRNRDVPDAADRFRYLSEEPPESRAAFQTWLDKVQASDDPLYFSVIDKSVGQGGRSADLHAHRTSPWPHRDWPYSLGDRPSLESRPALGRLFAEVTEATGCIRNCHYFEQVIAVTRRVQWLQPHKAAFEWYARWAWSWLPIL